jgi:HEAT repeat protein
MSRKSLMWGGVCYLISFAAGPVAQALAADPGAVTKLLAALEDEDLQVVRQAVVTLGNLKDRSAVEPLCVFLTDQSKQALCRSGVPEALQKLDDQRAVPALLQGLNDPNHFVRFFSERALAGLHWQPSTDRERAYCAMARQKWDETVKLGTAAVEPLLVALTTTNDPQIRLAAAEALAKLSWEPANDAERAWLLAAQRDWEAAAKLGPSAVEPLLTVFAEAVPQDFALGQAARHALVGMGPVAVKPLITLLQGKHAGVSPAAASLLGDLKDPRGVEPLLAVLNDPRYPRSTASRAADALGRLGDKRAFEPLVAMLKDKSPVCRHRAVAALRELGDPRAIELLTAALQDEAPLVRESAGRALAALRQQDSIAKQLQDPSVEVRMSAALALTRMGDRRALAPSLAALKDKNPQVRRRAAEALGQLRDQVATEPLIAAIRDADRGVRWSAAAALGRLGDPGAVAPLIEALKDQDAWVRRGVADALGRLGDRRAVEPLRAALKCEDGTVITTAAVALATLLKDESAVEPLLAALEHPDSHGTRVEVFGAIVMIGPPALKPFTAGLQSPSSRVRREVVECLTLLGDENGVEPLIQALADAEGDVARAAAYGLAELDDPRAVSPLTAAIKDRRSALWRGGSQYLAKQGDRIAGLTAGAPGDLEPFLSAMEDSRWPLRLSAVWLLGRTGDRRVTDALATVLKSVERSRQHEEQTHGVWLCGQALARLQNPLAIRPLVNVIKQHAIDEPEDPNFPHLSVWLRRLRQRRVSKVLEALAALGPAVVEPLAALLKDHNPGARTVAAQGLGRLGDKRAIVALQSALQDTNQQVRDSSAEAIRAIRRRNQ